MSTVLGLDPAAPRDDIALARRVAGGERDAFVVLMRRHNRRLYRLARAMLRDDAEAEDALQEAYLAAHRAIDGFRGQASLSTWLTSLLRNECLTRLRRQARRQDILPMVAHDDHVEREADMAPDEVQGRPEQAVARLEVRRLIERTLDTLPVDFRTVFVLRAAEELSVEETAAVLDIPAATVRTRYFRARALLRDALARETDLAENDVYEFGGARCDRVVANMLQRLDGG